MLVKPKVKETLLKEYIKQCRQLQKVAFYQWRLKYPNALTFNEELIQDMIIQSFTNFSKKTIALNSHGYLISSFEAIGWSDPFSEGCKDLILASPMDELYHSSRSDLNRSPLCMYIPSKDLMIKMMKACIGKSDPLQLWIYN